MRGAPATAVPLATGRDSSVARAARDLTLITITRVAGLLLAISSCAYLGHVAWQATNIPGALVNAFPEALPRAAALVACALAMALLASGWHLALNAVGAASPPSCAAVAYALSQPATYLPGNVLHFASRHVLGRRAGHPHTVLVQASMV